MLDRRLAHREDGLVRDHEVDLGVEDLLPRLDVGRGEEDAEDVGAMALHRGPRLVLVDMRAQQQPHRALFELARRLLSQLRLAGIEQVDPDRSHGR